MQRTTVLVLAGLLSALSVFGQRTKQQVFFSDIDNFWVAYDSIRTTTDSLKQLQYLHQFYIGKGTAGLKAFMAAKGYTPPDWVGSIRHYPKFWNSIRPNTQLAKAGARGIEPYLKKFAVLYPALRPASCISPSARWPPVAQRIMAWCLSGPNWRPGPRKRIFPNFPSIRRCF